MQAFLIFAILTVLAGDVQGQHRCKPFSCGHLQDIRHPFRQRGDPRRCGVSSYELDCSSGKATIQINTGTYYVTSINYNESSFWVVDANLQDDTNNHCPLPRSNHRPFIWGIPGPGYTRELTLQDIWWATFVNCSQAVKNNTKYMHVDCLSTRSSFVYVLNVSPYALIENLEPSCGYFAMIPVSWIPASGTTYPYFAELMRKGFSVRFPFVLDHPTAFGLIKKCLNQSIRFVLAPLAVLIFLAQRYWKTRITIDAVERFLRMQLMLGPTRYTYTDIIALTSHFREKLGHGGFGSVFKGVILPGDVAIKMLANYNCTGDEFISEVSTIGSIHHVNVVRLVGFCAEEMRRALVYEYMPNGSLDKFIFSPEKSFSWDKLNEIALGIAKGMNYLHQGCEMQIVHFDIKPHNILLDSNFVPKVADFGLAKLYPQDNSFVPVSAARGTVGYIAPEMISRSFGVISSKSDIYSFGMLLLEMAGGRRNSKESMSSSSQAYYPSWVYNHLVQEEMGEIANACDMHELEKKLCIVGLHCIQMKPQDRPTMSKIYFYSPLCARLRCSIGSDFRSDELDFENEGRVLLLSLIYAAATAWYDEGFSKSCSPQQCSKQGPWVRFPLRLAVVMLCTGHHPGSPSSRILQDVAKNVKMKADNVVSIHKGGERSAIMAWSIGLP
uniref:Protein kinase domain-containing protein n=1 Tax=Leersia perrieri TaxID=77586 RepID=A0A0D9UW21_9ORYZ